MGAVASSVTKSVGITSKAEITAPTTYVEVVFEAEGRRHNLRLGRTNTEYSTCNPSYGSNAHRGQCPHTKPMLSYSAEGSVRLEDPPSLAEYDAMTFCVYVSNAELVSGELVTHSYP